MERIYKKICLEDSRSRLQGLMPFIKFGDSGITSVTADDFDGNWGGYPANPETGKTYMDVLYRYHRIWKQLRDGVYLKKLSVTSRECQCAPYGLSWTEQYKDDKNPYDFTSFDRKYFHLDESYGTYFLNDEIPEGLENDEFIVLVEDPEEMKQCANYLREDGDWAEFCKTVDSDYIGKVVIPADMVKLGDRVPYVMYCADIPQYLQWMKDNENSDDCCIQELWRKRGGSGFTEYLENLDCKWTDPKNTEVPTIDVSIFLRQNFADEGAFVPHTETWYDDYDGDDEIGYVNESGEKVGTDNRGALSWPYKMESKRWVAENEEDRIEVPSYLPNMMHTPYFYDDNKVMLPGKLKRFGPDGDGFFKCTYYEEESKQPSIATEIRITYKLDNDRTYSTTIDQGCTQEERSAWPKENAYQIVAPKLYNVRINETSEETTGEYAVGQQYNGHEIVSSTTYHTETYAGYGWWEAVKVDFDPDTRMPADGDISVYTNPTPENPQYRVLTMLEDIYSLVPSDCNVDDVPSDALNPGDCYYFLVTYDNGPINPSETQSCNAGSDTLPVGEYVSADIPFDLGAVLNMKTMNDEGTVVMGDSVLKADPNSATSSITLTYVIGGLFDSNDTGFTYRPNTGTILKETHDYIEAKPFEYKIDGVSGVTIYCNYIDFESDKKLGVSSYNGLSGLSNTSFITEMPVGDVATSPSGSIRSVIYKEDYLLGMSYEPETDINISYDNGTATAWEKHFKLGECNTMSDLVNYGNDEFGLNN